MNAFQRRDSKMDDPIEQGTSCYEQEEKGQGINATKSLFYFIFEKQSHFTIIRRSDSVFCSTYFSRSTENDAFI